MTNKLRTKINELLNTIISHFQWSFGIIGIICLVFAYLTFNDGKEVTNLTKFIDFTQDVVGQIGGILLSISIISLSFEKWRDQKEHLKEKYYLVNSQQLETGDELSKFDLFRCNGKGKILPIMDGEQLRSGDYQFKKMLVDKFNLLEGQTILVYGTTLNFLEKLNDIFCESVKSGVNYTFALTNPQLENLNDDELNVSIHFLNMQIDKLNKEKCTRAGSIEVRFTPYFTPHSFSSFVYKNNRKVRTLDFNFCNSDKNIIKYSQVFDTLSTNPGDRDLEIISDNLHNQYSSYYKKSLPALIYSPNKNEIKIFICGIKKEPISGGIKKQIVLCHDMIPCLSLEYDNIQTYIYVVASEQYKELTGYTIELKKDISVTNDVHTYCLVGEIMSGTAQKNISVIEAEKWKYVNDPCTAIIDCRSINEIYN